MMTLKTLNQLWRLADEEAQRNNTESQYVFLSIGLRLHRPLNNAGYKSTPINTSTFASTGGDGVHYGLLHLNGNISDDSPVVMTVPMNWDNPNLIVGKNLTDFLSLGCQTGYFALEQLVYDKQETVAWLENPEKTWEKNNLTDASRIEKYRLKQNLLDFLTRKFGLKSWDNIEQRLAQLQQQYLPLLKLPSDNT
jgi:hypothetical protein